MSRHLRCVVASLAAAVLGSALLLAQGPGAAPGGARGAVPTPEFSDAVLEITPPVLDRLAQALAAEESGRRGAAAKAAAGRPHVPTQPPKTRKEYQECQQGVMIGPEYSQLMQEYTAAVSGQGKDTAAARKASSEVMVKLGALLEARCGPDPGRPATGEAAADVRKAEKAAAEAGGFTVRQYAVLKERVTPLCLSDPAPPDPRGSKVKGEGNAFLVYTAAEVAALRPRCDAFVKLLFPDQD